jgi:RNA polymerase sigma-70 factor, ECF subfamily
LALFYKRKINFDINNLSSVLVACLTQDRGAQAALIRLYHGYALTVCRSYAKSSMDVEEIINDGFLKVFSNLHTYDATKPFKAWLRSIFVHTSVDHYRKIMRFDNIVSLESYIEHPFDTDVIDQLSADEILAHVQKLPTACRVVFNLYVIEGYTHKEIGGLLNIQEGTSKSNLRDAREKLKKILQTNNNLSMNYELPKIKS